MFFDSRRPIKNLRTPVIENYTKEGVLAYSSKRQEQTLAGEKQIYNFIKEMANLAVETVNKLGSLGPESKKIAMLSQEIAEKLKSYQEASRAYKEMFISLNNLPEFNEATQNLRSQQNKITILLVELNEAYKKTNMEVSEIKPSRP